MKQFIQLGKDISNVIWKLVTFRGMYYTSTNRLWVRNTSWKQEFHDLNSPLKIYT
jgi:hypothetical protein